MTSDLAGAHSFTLLGAGSRFYPNDYIRGESGSEDRDMRATLADQLLAQRMQKGESAYVTVIWPDPDPDADRVSIDVPGVFRITDVPVTPETSD